MATKVLSIEIGFGLTKVAETDFHSKNAKVYQCFSFETPKDVISDGMVSANETFRSLLKQECARRGINTDKVVFTINSSRMASREVVIPQVKENKIAALLKANAADYFPVDLSQYHLAYTVLGKVEESDTKQLKLNVMAVPLDIINSFYELASYCGLTIQALDYIGNSVFQAVKKSFADSTAMVIKIEERSSLVTFLQQGAVTLQRNVSYGVNEAIEELQESGAYGEHLTYSEAIEALSKNTCIRRRLDADATYKEDEDAEDAVYAARVKITEALRYLIGNIGRVMSYFTSRNTGVTIDQIVLVGLGSEFSGLDKLLTNELQQKVTVLQDIDGVTFDKGVDNIAQKTCNYAACIGAAMEPLDMIPEERKKKGKEKNTDGEKSGSGKAAYAGYIVLAACVGISVILGVISAANFFMAKAQHSRLENRLVELAPIENIHAEYLQSQAEYNDLSSMYLTTQTPNEELVAFIEELETKMPKEITVLSLNASNESVSMSITVKSKEAAARVLLQLRSFASLNNVESSSFSHSKDESGASTVSFSANCTYKAVEPAIRTEAAETAEGTGTAAEQEVE